MTLLVKNKQFMHYVGAQQTLNTAPQSINQNTFNRSSEYL